MGGPESQQGDDLYLVDAKVPLVDVKGPGIARLTTAGGINGRPSVSPDGSRIAFQASGSDPRLGLYLMDADGADLNRVSDQLTGFLSG